MIIGIISLLGVETSSFSTDINNDNDFDISSCTKNHPCYYENGSLHLLENIDSDNGWNSYSITDFSVGIGTSILVPLAIPIVHVVMLRAVDYLSYKYKNFYGLRDGGAVLQAEKLEQIHTSVSEISNNSFLISQNLRNIADSHGSALELQQNILNLHHKELDTYQENARICHEELNEAHQERIGLINQNREDVNKYYQEIHAFNQQAQETFHHFSDLCKKNTQALIETQKVNQSLLTLLRNKDDTQQSS